MGKAFIWVLAGFFVLAVNHFLDTVFLADYLKSAGHTADFWQGPIVHRVINLIGFILMTVGFLKITRQQS